MSDVKQGAGPQVARPLSPHLQIYRRLLTMMTSITHRITGAGLFFGTALLAWWLIAAATGPEAFETVQAVMGSILGRLVLLGFTWALFFHLLNGIRHLFWDVGLGFEIKTAELTARLVWAGSIGLTLLAWIIGYAMMGGA